jgi:hemerythrin superfamily protein
MNGIDLLTKDHRRVQQLFSRFFQTEMGTTQEHLLEQIQSELLAHAEAEEHVLYPAIKTLAAESVNQALKEHASIKETLIELLCEDGDEDAFESRFNQLFEEVCQHVEKEEGPGGVMEIARKNLDEDALSRMALQIKSIKRGVANAA